MSLLHDYFNTGNLQHFQRLLESTGSDKTQSTGPSSSGAKPWKKHGDLGSTNVDINGRDWLGRTVLHLASTSLEHLDYVRALLRHPAINVNLPDTESHWTPLHRSLYNANLPAARLLLQRSDIDIYLKDYEGYTGFELYNSTLNGTKPSPEEGDAYGDLFTWGANVNATLGHGDSNDRRDPEQVMFPHKDDIMYLESLSVRFLPVRVKQVVMSKLHTAVITSESEGNLRVCGFGSGGRLGPSSHTQYNLKPLSQLSQTIISIALGQDHTLALTKNGEVLSWGLNRFSQLGYLVDPPVTGRAEEPIQYTPRKVQGPLRKEVVRGVAASKCASACWTEDSVYTWGTNNGQLGYDKVAQPVQVQPRKVPRLTSPVISITMTENAMACLMQNRQVECFYNDGYHRINFPTHAFPSPIRPYRPPEAVKDSHMVKITSCGDVFASLSHHGEVYIFSPTNFSITNAASSSSTTNPNDAESSTRTGGPFKCQRVWALRKKSTAVKDVALGADGSIIICTESGHVFVRTRNLKSSSGGSGGSGVKAFKFQLVPFLQRVTKVFANASGGFGALRVDFGVKDVGVKGYMGAVIGGDVAKVRPWVKFGVEEEDVRFAWMKEGGSLGESMVGYSSQSHSPEQGSDDEDVDVEMEDDEIGGDIRTLKEMCDVIKREERMRKEEVVKAEEMKLPHGADTLVHLPSEAVFPAHRVMLATRSRVLCKILSATTKKAASVFDEQRNVKISLLPPLRRSRPNLHHITGPGSKELTQLSITGCHPFSVLILLNYIYSDNVVAVWDRRVSHAVEPYAKTLKVKLDPVQIRNEIQGLARALELGQVLRVLERPVKFSPEQAMVLDLARLLDSANPPTSPTDRDKESEVVASREGIQRGGLYTPTALSPDVVLELEDREVRTHSVILRSRSELFQSFFDEPDWTKKRWGAGASGGEGGDRGEDGVVRVDLRHLRWHVMEYVLRFLCCGCDKEMFQTLEFVKNVDDLLEFMFEIMAAANELLLDRLVLICSSVIQTYANVHNACYILADATHFSATQLVDRIQSYITANMELFLESHMLDDISEDLVIQLSRYVQDKQKEKAPFVRGGQPVGEATRKWKDWLELQDFPEPFVRRNKSWHVKQNVLPLPKFEKRLEKLPSGDDLFTMDDADVSAHSATDIPQPAGGPGVAPGWKVYVAPKVDMRAVMAEEAAGQVGAGTVTNKPGEVPRMPSKLQHATPRTIADSPQSSGSPWKTQPQQQGNDQTPRASPPGLPLSQPSTPQKQKESLRIAGRTPSSGQLPTATPTKQAQGSGSSAAAPSGLVMGPTITPTRMPASSSKSTISQRNTSGSSKAWAYTRPVDTPPPTTPATQSASRENASGKTTDTTDTTTNIATPSKSKSMSFLAIQSSQQEEQLGDPSKDSKRSLLDIQEEERARRQEEEFLKWWKEEEGRMRMEMEALETFKAGQEQSLSEGGSGKQRRGGRGGKDGGRTGGKRGERGGGRGGLKGRKEGKNTQPQGRQQSDGNEVAEAQGDAGPSQAQASLSRPRHRKSSQLLDDPSQAQGDSANTTSTQTPASRPYRRKPSQKYSHQQQVPPPVPAHSS